MTDESLQEAERRKAALKIWEIAEVFKAPLDRPVQIIKYDGSPTVEMPLGELLRRIDKLDFGHFGNDQPCKDDSGSGPACYLVVPKIHSARDWERIRSGFRVRL